MDRGFIILIQPFSIKQLNKEVSNPYHYRESVCRSLCFDALEGSSVNGEHSLADIPVAALDSSVADIPA